MRFFALILIFFASAAPLKSWAQITRSTSFDLREICEKSKGVWRQFGNGCVDECESKFDKYKVCSNSASFGCDCGKNRCFADDSCIMLSDYQKIFAIKQEEEKRLLDEAKEKRKSDASAYRQEMMEKFVNAANAQAQGQTYDSTGKDPAPRTNFPDVYKKIMPDSNLVQQFAPAQPQVQIVTPVEGQIIAVPNSGQIVSQTPSSAEVPMAQPTPFFLKQQEQLQKVEAEKKLAEEISKKLQEEAAKKTGSPQTTPQKKEEPKVDEFAIPGLPVIPLPN